MPDGSYPSPDESAILDKIHSPNAPGPGPEQWEAYWHLRALREQAIQEGRPIPPMPKRPK